MRVVEGSVKCERRFHSDDLTTWLCSKIAQQQVRHRLSIYVCMTHYDVVCILPTIILIHERLKLQTCSRANDKSVNPSTFEQQDKQSVQQRATECVQPAGACASIACSIYSLIQSSTTLVGSDPAAAVAEVLTTCSLLHRPAPVIKPSY